MKKRELLIGLLALCLLLCACQPTPEEEIVTNKGDGVMEEKIFATAAPTEEVAVGEEAQPTEEPVERVSHWTETFSVNENLPVEIDCDVRWGDGNTQYVEKCEAGEFTPEMVVNIGNAFFKDITGLREQETSYDELLTELMNLERGWYNGRDDEGNVIWEPYDNKYKSEETARIKALMETTPVDSTYVAFEAENIELKQMDVTPLTLQLKNGKEGKMSVILAPGNNTLSCSVYTDDSGIFRERSLLFQKLLNDLPEPAITEEEAIHTADAFFASLGLNTAECSNGEKAYYGTVSEHYSDGWYLQYGLAMEGTRGVYLYEYSRNALFRKADVGEYAEPLEAEGFEVYVTENGVEYFAWYNPYTSKEVINESIEILPFEDIQESVRKYFKLAFAWAEDTAGTGTEKLIVKDVVLTSTCTYVKDDLENAYRIPTWAIFYLGDDEERMSLHNSVMLINAIDGTLIYK